MNYIDKMHRYGRIWAVITCSVIMAFPFVLAICFSAWPDLGEFFNSLYPIALTFWPVGIIEVITYTPMLGVGGTYLGFVTGNLSSLKVPCALDSMEKANVKADSDEGEVISTISIATSSIVTILIIFVGVLLLSSISGFLSSDIMAPAFDNVLPALFGGLGVVYLSRYFKIAVLPMALMVLLFIFVPYLNSGMVGIMIPVSMVITLLYSRYLYNKSNKALATEANEKAEVSEAE
ncbi:MAG: hypothetical protein IJY23_03860 [Clostridia bacterium]|nr:hypothetical protein [Clostridia bacterium]